MKHAWKFIICAAALLLVMLRADPTFHTVEKKIYSAYTESMITQGDLNALNHLPFKERWLVTATHNYPDMHSNGVVAIWSPFFLYQRLLESLGLTDPAARETGFRICQSMMSVILGFLALFISLLNVRKLFPEGDAPTAPVIVLAVGTPFFWHWIFQPENADITSCLVGSLILYFYLQIERNTRVRDWAVLGALLAFGFAVKLDLLYYTLILILPLFQFLRKREYAVLGKISLAVFAGYAPVLAAVLTNEFIKTGTLNYGYLDTITTRYYILRDILFSPSGYLTNSPLYLFCLAAVAWAIHTRQSLLLVLFLIPLTKVITESFNYVHGESFGARHWISDFPIFAILFAGLWSRLKHTRALFLGCLPLIALFVLWNLLMAGCYAFDYDTYFFSGQCVSRQFLQPGFAARLIAFIFDFKQTHEKLSLYAPLTALGVGAAFLAARYSAEVSRHLKRFLPAGAIILCLVYCFMTLLNVKNNWSDGQALARSGALDRSAVANGPHAWFLFENVGSLEKSIRYFSLRGDTEKLQIRRKVLRDYLNLAAREIVQDPASVREQLSKEADFHLDPALSTD